MFNPLLKASLLTFLACSSAFAANPVKTPIIDRGLELYIQPFSEVLGANNKVLRLNTIITQGDQIYVTSEEGLVFNITDGTSQLVADFEALWPQSTGNSLNHDSIAHSGLRGLAFSPNFSTDGKIYTAAMEDRAFHPEDHHYLSDVNDPVEADSVVSEWQVVDGEVDPDSYRELFRVGMPVFDHPIKDLAFGPDGMLYIAHGDASVKSAVAGGGMGNDALGKILRIDPTPSDNLAYTIPADNPFIGDSAMLDEVWSFGHRNPHTFSFSDNGTLIVGEPGRDNIEEINVVVKGQNYGWPAREGTFVHLENGGIVSGVETLPSNDADYGYTYPVAQFGHEGNYGDGFVGQAVAGGFTVENGSPVSGEYFCGDFGTIGDIYHISIADIDSEVTTGNPQALKQAQPARARLYFDHDSNPNTPAQLKSSFNDIIDDAPTWTGATALGQVRSDLRFGKGPKGEMYISSKRNGLVYLVSSTLPGGPGGIKDFIENTVQAESGQTVGTSTVTQNHAGYTGTGAINKIFRNGSGVKGLILNSKSGGVTTLNIRYSKGPHGPAVEHRTLGVIVNGERQAQASFRSTGAWDAWSVTSVKVDLKAGNNVIDLIKQNEDTGWVDLDSISTRTPISIQVEAETGQAVGSSSVTQKQTGYSGTGAIHKILHPGSGVEGLVANAVRGGATTVNIRYSMGPHGPAEARRTLGVIVNGERQAQASFRSTGAWNSWSTTSVNVDLNVGHNVIDLIFQDGDTGWVNIDFISFAPTVPVY